MRHDSRTFLPIHSLIASVALCCAGTLPLLAERPATLTNYQFVSVTPCRVVDTRNANGAFGGPAIPGGTSRSFTIPASPTCTGIPSTAAAYSLNVTVVPEGDLGYLTVWPAGETQPVVSTLNSLDGRIKANAAIVPAGTLGAVSVFASNTTKIVTERPTHTPTAPRN